MENNLRNAAARALLSRVAVSLSLLGIAADCALAADCPVRFLNRGDAEEIDAGYRDKIIPRIGNYQRAVVQEALNAVPPLICASVARVVFVHDAGKDAVAFVNTTRMINRGRPADLIYFNDAAMPESRLEPFMVDVGEEREDAQEGNRVAAVRAVIHEAVHVADHLLDSQRKDTGFLGEDPVDESLWRGAAVRTARESVSKNLLQVGFRQEWARLHASFVAAGMAREYYGDGGGADLKDIVKLTSEKDADGRPVPAKDRFGREIMINPAPIELAGAGFMTRYGGTQPGEDIAEMAASLLTRAYVQEKLGGTLEPGGALDAAIDDHACGALQALPGPGITTDVAAVYAKAGFLQAVGLVPESAFRHCVGNLAIRGDGEGFHSWKVDDLANRYSENVQVGLGRSGPSAPVVFQMTARGSVSTSSGRVPVTVELAIDVSPAPAVVDAMMGIADHSHVELDDVSFARGVYLIGDRHGSNSRLRIRRNDNDAIIMEVSQGIALVGRASSALVEGTVVIQRYFNFSGGLLSSVAGDVPVGEPTTMTFRWTSGAPDCQPGMNCPIP